jgi:hypothetical protein
MVMIGMMAIEEAAAERLCVRDAAEPLRPCQLQKLLAYFAFGMLQLFDFELRPYRSVPQSMIVSAGSKRCFRARLSRRDCSAVRGFGSVVLRPRLAELSAARALRADAVGLAGPPPKAPRGARSL